MKINKGTLANDTYTPRSDSASGFYEPAAGMVVSLPPPRETFNADVIFFSYLPSSKTPFIPKKRNEWCRFWLRRNIYPRVPGELIDISRQKHQTSK